MVGAPRSAAEVGTLRSRRIHYLMFANAMRWHDDLLMQPMSLERANLQLAIYAAHLGNGNTLWHRQIKCATIKHYVNAAASFACLFGTHPRDPRRQTIAEAAVCPPLQAVYKELSRWEDIPNRREPFTTDMLADLQRFAAGSDQDSLAHVMADWAEIGLFTGHRLSEWAQPSGNGSLAPDNIQNNFRGAPKAFQLSDVRIMGPGERHLPLSYLLAHGDSAVCYVLLRWRTQKNGAHGEVKKYTRNPSPTGPSLVSPMLRVLRRFERLRGFADTFTPIALYRCASGAIRLVTANDITSSLRACACRVYGLDPVRQAKTVQLWSAHSFRVGAACILHAAGYSETDIMFLLRWRSRTFMMYLRNLAIISRRQVAAVDRAASVPNFIE